LTAPLLGGQPPLGVPGARLSSRANDAVIRPALALVLVTSGLKLLGIDNQLGLLVLALVLLAVPVWALDATLHPEPAWAGAPVGRRMTVGVQLVGAPLDLGFVAALAYFGLLRPGWSRPCRPCPRWPRRRPDPDHPLSSANVLPASGMPGDQPTLPALQRCGPPRALAGQTNGSGIGGDRAGAVRLPPW